MCANEFSEQHSFKWEKGSAKAFSRKWGISSSSLESQAVPHGKYCSAMHNRYLIVLYDNGMRGSERTQN